MEGPTVDRVRWWKDGASSIEAERARFTEAELDFRLDEELFQLHEVVVFRGELKLDDKRAKASVHYPPAYGVGAHPTVVAPGLHLGRHQDPTGALCLDHPGNEVTPMSGAEAVQLAERLWDLWENDRQQLSDEEADAPDPRANYYAYQPNSAVTMLDVDVSGFDAGYIKLGALELKPFRAGVTEVRMVEPTESELEIAAGIESFAGPYEVSGSWIRVHEAPPVIDSEFQEWVKEHHLPWFEEVLSSTQAARELFKRPELPAVFGFVYPDEGPGHGELHDAWLFLIVSPDGQGRVARTFHLRSDERWLRQPQLYPLAEKKVAVIGAGALGSPLADLLAKAGIGNLYLLDPQIYSVGNRVRHQLDLTDLGRDKVQGLANRVLRVNPWTKVDLGTIRLGAAIYGPHETQQQAMHDAILQDFAAHDLIINATAHTVTSYYCSRLARVTKKPMLHVWVSAGAWGGRILLQRPRFSGCPECLALFQRSESEHEQVEVPRVASDPEVQEVHERGCADTTFTGPGFELTAAAAAAARVAVQSLLDGDGYPAPEFDLATLNFRTQDSALPSAVYSRLPEHPDCSICSEG